MSTTRVAHRYAKAIINYAQEKQKEQALYKDMQAIESILSKSEELESVLSNPIINVSEKKVVLDSIFREKINIVSQKTIHLLLENNRIELLRVVARQCILLLNRKNHKVIANVISAVALSKKSKQDILDKVKELTGKNVTLENTVKPKIIGGFILRIDDLQYDASVLNKFKSILRGLKGNGDFYIDQV